MIQRSRRLKVKSKFRRFKVKASSHSHSCGHRRATLNLDPPRQVGGNLTTCKQLGLTDSLQSLSDGQQSVSLCPRARRLSRVIFLFKAFVSFCSKTAATTSLSLFHVYQQTAHSCQLNSNRLQTDSSPTSCCFTDVLMQQRNNSS